MMHTTNFGFSTIGLDSQAAFSMCELLRRIAKNGLAVLCVLNQPSARLLQIFDRLLLLGKGGKQLYFGKIGTGSKTMINYFERNGARPCNTDENPAEWMLEITSPIENSDGSRDWSKVWKDSSECKAVKAKLSQLRGKFSANSGLISGPETPEAAQHSAPWFDAMALQRKSAILLVFLC